MRTWNKLLDCLGGRYLRLEPWIPETYYYAARVISRVFFFYFLLHVWYCLRCRMTMAGNLTASPPKKRGHGILNIHLHECTFIWLYGVWPFSNTHKLFDGALLSRLFPPPIPLFFLFFRISALTSYSHRLLLPLVCNQRKSTVVTVISNPWISVCSTKPPYWTPGDKDEAILLGLTSVSS